MEKKNIVLFVFIAVIAISLTLIAKRLDDLNHAFTVNTDANGNIVAEARNATPDSSGIGYVTVAEGQRIEFSANLTSDSCISVNISKDTKGSTEHIYGHDFYNNDTGAFTPNPGEYVVEARSGAKATGSLIIKVVQVEAHERK